MSKNWSLNPETGDYVMSNGAPVETASLQIPAYLRLKTRRTKWLYAPDDSFGSDLYLLKKRRSSQDATTIEAVCLRALNPIVEDGRAESIDATTKASTRYGLGVQIDILDAQGEPEQLNLERIGI